MASYDTYEKIANASPVLQQSTNTKKALSQTTNYENQASKMLKSGYSGTWSEQLNSAINKYANRNPFSYSTNNSATYQQAKDQYTKNGQKAMQDTLANANLRNGGFDTSYGTAAAQQSYNDYMSKLSDIAVQDEQNKLSEYSQQGNDMINLINTLMTADTTEYSRWQDKYNNITNFATYYLNKYGQFSSEDQERFQNEWNTWQQKTNLAQSDYQFAENLKQQQKEFAESIKSNSNSSDKTKVTTTMFSNVVSTAREKKKKGSKSLYAYLNNLDSIYYEYVPSVLNDLGLPVGWLDTYYNKHINTKKK